MNKQEKMMTKRTVEVEYLKGYVNSVLEHNTNLETRITMTLMLEAVLQRTGNYKGYKLLDKDNEVDHFRREYI
jgi:hypothetical protein